MSCVAPGCKSGYGSDCKLPPGVTKHIFPKETLARQAWIDAVPRDDWSPSLCSVLCSLHFTDDDFQVERCDTNPHRKNGDLKRRRLKKGAVPSVFAVNEDERCLVPSCRRISNTHSFPRYPDQRKKWVLHVRNYFLDSKWHPNQYSRICSKHFSEDMICKVFRRPDKLKPNAIPNIEKEMFPPNVVKEYPKITPMPAILPKEDDPFKPVGKFQNTITVKQEAQYQRLFVLDKSPAKRTLVPSKSETVPGKPESFQLQQLQTQPQLQPPRPPNVNQITDQPSQDPIILMRTKGNPNVLVQVEAQLWTPTGKMPKLPPVQSTYGSTNGYDSKNGQAVGIKANDSEMKDKTIERLRTECAKLTKRVSSIQDQANDTKTKMDKIVKNLASLFGEDQVTLLCGGPVRRCNQWSDKTLAKAFDLRLNCGDRAYKYLLEQGYPLPSIKTMQRHIRNVEVKLQHPEATYITTTADDSDTETVEIHQGDSSTLQTVVPVHHTYLQTQYSNSNQPTLVKVSQISGSLMSGRSETISVETSQDMGRPSPAKRAKKQDSEGPIWYSKLSKEVRQKILFPDQPLPNELITHTVQAGTTMDRIYLAQDLEYAVIPMNDASGQAMVQQVTVQHKDIVVEDGEKEYTTMNVSTGAPIHLHVVDEENRTIQVLNVDNQGFVF